MRDDQFHILRAAHAELMVTDLGRSREFYEMLGFVVTEATENQLYLRGVEERVHHSLVLTKSDVPLVGHLSFRVHSEDDLDRLYDFYAAANCRPRWREAGSERGQGRALWVRDPFGFPIEYFAAMDQVQSYNQLYHLHRGGAVRRMDHFNCFVPEFDHAFSFWTEKLGFVLSEYVESDDEPREKSAAWLHRKPSVHDLAIMKGTGPRVHHLGFWMEDMNSIIRVCDILGGAALHEHIERGPGRHGISNAFFLYLRDPDGHRIELYTNDYLTIDPDMEPIRWSSTDPRRQTLWGHATPETWWRDASPVWDLDADAPAALRTVDAPAALKGLIK
ncbi:MAG: 3,4-dihydroxyphenylacetate 2,3-dioxygenase [Alicyclobacillus macrosporangiidus]|uniref:3,4-dihydroxyphenylacetate 2,3-dioxygenase n=1 Tax=Alicyclobacillus macrosporangiidus TaxID=392015 RepID=UPI0026EF166E|nr:3,4-dihydroxyphenylacetate 2,3-dioxygenase [Alicyclobacillus macrosporangiidus]MCL6599721.1 3,4-dihydroxyphenylacetate 2,3-dioxygenase [Alicyclobacillus macrosporangiidus]